MHALAEKTTTLDLGERLMNVGLLTRPQLDLARREQRLRSHQLSKVVVDLGLVDPENVADFLANQAATERVHLSKLVLDPAVVDVVPRGLSREHRLLPIDRNNGSLTLAMSDPCDIRAIDRVRQITGLELHIVAATEQEILDQLDRLDAHTEDIQESIDQILANRQEEARLFGVEGPGDVEAEEPEESDAPTVALVGQIIKRAVERGASDVHFEPEARMMRIRFRIDGVLQPDMLIPKSVTPLVSARLKVMADLNVSENRVPQDGRASVTVGRRTYHLRVSSLPTAYGRAWCCGFSRPTANSCNSPSWGWPPKPKGRSGTH
ncbi:MAG: Flp pilus assembly complex ATPase component TadA [Verrucomicrobiales bacterium]|nr:Flp pilus assembly complex ATPase component TadA [Verrucomicrobiales bacterium]